MSRGIVRIYQASHPQLYNSDQRWGEWGSALLGLISTHHTLSFNSCLSLRLDDPLVPRYPVSLRLSMLSLFYISLFIYCCNNQSGVHVRDLTCLIIIGACDSMAIHQWVSENR